jgi:CheY-like chemotaxis protein
MNSAAQLAPAHSILVVDDEDGIRQMLKLALEFRGYRVTTAANGRDALSLLDSEPAPCVIILDLMMPILDGPGFLAEMEKRATLARIPVILATGYAANTATPRATEVITKPLDLTYLYDRVAALCAGAPA